MIPLFIDVGIGSTAAILAGAIALGIRHGMDWDHIAAITDITSASAVAPEEHTVEGAVGTHSHHPGRAGVLLASDATGTTPRASFDGGGLAAATMAMGPQPRPRLTARWPNTVANFVRRQSKPLVLATMYALGHGSMVFALGLSAILFAQILPAWIDPLMQRIVGVTLVLLSFYLFFSLYRYFRGGEEFRIRSRWMLVFAVVARTYHRLLHRLSGEHQHVHASADQYQYGRRTAYGIGLIHGVGAETGTQVLIIGAAVGAGSKGMGILTLLAFVAGILISNSLVALATTSGFVSAGRRQAVYVVVGAVAAIFSLTVGLVFLADSSGSLPNLDSYFRWVGGPG